MCVLARHFSNLGILSKIGKSFLVDVITKAASRNMLYHFGFAGHLLTPWSSVAQVTKQIWSLLDDVDWPPIPGLSMVRLEVRSLYTFEVPMVSALHKIFVGARNLGHLQSIFPKT